VTFVNRITLRRLWNFNVVLIKQVKMNGWRHLQCLGSKEWTSSSVTQVGGAEVAVFWQTVPNFQQKKLLILKSLHLPVDSPPNGWLLAPTFVFLKEKFWQDYNISTGWNLGVAAVSFLPAATPAAKNVWTVSTCTVFMQHWHIDVEIISNPERCFFPVFLFPPHHCFTLLLFVPSLVN